MVGGTISRRLKTEKLTFVASLVNFHNLRAKLGLVGPVSI